VGARHAARAASCRRYDRHSLALLHGGGGSCAFDRRKFLELGGFDALLRPFYMEDSDLGLMAWKRGWRIFYQPKSRVWHEHRGTIGRKFPRSYIDDVIRKNAILYAWKNAHAPSRLLAHFGWVLTGGWYSWIAGPSLERASLRALWRGVPPIERSVARPLARPHSGRGRRERSVPALAPIYYHDRYSSFEREPAARGFCLSAPMRCGRRSTAGPSRSTALLHTCGSSPRFI